MRDMVAADSTHTVWGESGTWIAPPTVPRDEPLPEDRIATLVGGTDKPVTGPKDVPSIRAALIADWERLMRLPTPFNRSDDGVQLRTLDKWEHRKLQEATLVWVADELTDLVDELRPSLPDDTTLDPDDAPFPSGFTVFARSMQGLSATSDAELSFRAVLWGPVALTAYPQFGLPEQNAIGISVYDFVDFSNGLTGAQMGAMTEFWESMLRENRDVLHGVDAVRVEGGMWLPLGRSDWVLGTPVSDRMPFYSDEQWRSAVEDRRLLYTLWRLMAEEQVVEQSEVSRSKKARRRGSSRMRDATVRVLHLRRPRVDGPSVASEGEGRSITVRHLVRAHWRQQAYGPGWSLRRPLLIAPHWRGPEDGPVRVTETVWSLDR